MCALDRADFVGPSAQASKPLDNDSGGVDTDKSASVIQLSGGVYPEFRVQLVDGFETADPFPGIGIDDSTVVGPAIAGVRLTGAAITLFENGRVLEEGVDYRFSYDSTTNEVILTPLAGVWKDGRVYEVAVNNKNRFVLTAPAGDQVADGDVFTITDVDGGVVYYEFDSGYRLQVPQGLNLLIPLAGGATGGIADGDRFTITAGAQVVTFEFDRNGNFLSGNRPIQFVQGASQAEMAATVIAAIQASGLPVTPRLLSAGKVFLGADAGVQLDTTFTTITQPATTLAFKIPALGPRPGGIVEGQTFTISDGRRSETFEYDTDSVVTAGNTPLDFRGAATVADLTALTHAALVASSLNINPQIIGTDLVYLGLSPSGSASVGTSRLSLNGLARTLTDGQTFTIQSGGVTRTFEFTRDLTVGAGNTAISVGVNDTQDDIGTKVAATIAAAGLGLKPVHISDGNISIGGQASDTIDVTASSLGLFGKPGVQSRTRLQVFGPLLLTVPSRGAADINDNSTFRITNAGRTVVFEFDRNFSGASQPGNVVISYIPQNTASDIATAIATAIAGAGLGIIPGNLGNGILNLGSLQASQVQLLTSNLTTTRGVMNDGETFTINNGIQSVTFEFENVTFGNGFTAGNIPILFSATSTPDSVVQSMKAVIEGSSLGLTTTVLPNGTLELNDSPRYQIDSRGAPTLIKTGVPGGSNAVFFIQDANFTGADMVRAMVDSINASPGTRLTAMSRAGDTLFVENAISISPEIDNYFLRGVADLAGNLLKPNRINNETQFTILMPGVQLDYGDTPDPFTTTAGRYPTRHENDGARHVLSSTTSTSILLGSTITADANGTPTPDAKGDVDDGVTFDSPTLPIRGIFNRNISTSVTVTLSNPGYTDAWIDFNADGDWEDPGEKILDAVRFSSGALTRTFQITVPATAPIPAGPTTTFARFRSSSTGGLIPTGLAVDGEVEDYAITIVPGTPPTAVNDTYSFNEDSVFTSSDPNGQATPGFLIDDGVAANDQDPEGGALGVQIITFPSHAQTFVPNPNGDGTFIYRPAADFNGIDTFTYRVNDGVLTSNNIGTVTINVVTVNDSPVGGADTATTDEDVPLNLSEATLLSNDAAGPPNESSQTIRITGVSPVSDRAGSVSLVSGRIVYTPPANYSGPDRFTYTITDNGTSGGLAAPLSSVVVVNVTVLDKNDAPITVPKTGYATNEDVALDFTTAELIAGDTAGPLPSESGQSLVFNRVIATSTNGGTVVQISPTQVRYTPPKDFNGTDTFFYEVTDNGTSGNNPDPMTSRGTVTVTVRPAPDAPTVISQLGTITMLEDAPTRVIDLNTVFFDPDVAGNGDTLSFTVDPGFDATMVTPTISNGLLNLQLLADKNGSTTITIRATDSTNRSVTTSFTLVVTPVNDAPRLVNALPNRVTDEDITPSSIALAPGFFFDPDTGKWRRSRLHHCQQFESSVGHTNHYERNAFIQLGCESFG